jgi:hypothetical protein
VEVGVVITTETHHQLVALAVAAVQPQAKLGRLEIHQAQIQAKEIMAVLQVLVLEWVAVVAQVRLVQMGQALLEVMEAMEQHHQ